MAIITLYDIDEITVSDWARQNCASFVGWLVYEYNQGWFTDDDATWFMRYEFEFEDEHEAMLFQLRWDGQ